MNPVLTFSTQIFLNHGPFLVLRGLELFPLHCLSLSYQKGSKWKNLLQKEYL